jgi:hypothetical protein
MEEAEVTEQNAPLEDPYETLEPDAPTEGETYEPCPVVGDRDTDEAPPFDPSEGAGGPDRYQYGKLPTTIVSVVSERIESPMVCCGWASAQMAARTARAGVSLDLNNEGHRMRNRAGRPHNAGSNATERRNGLRTVLEVRTDPVPVSAILGRLRGGYAVVTALDYGRLPEHLKVQGGSFGHSTLLFGHRMAGDINMVGYGDPLWHQGDALAWCRWRDVNDALWDEGNLTTLAIYTPPPPPPPVHLRYGGRAHDHVYTVRGDGTNVRTAPRMGNNVHHQLNARDTFHAYQKTSTGDRVNGSKVWLGNRDGDRWLHSSVVR